MYYASKKPSYFYRPPGKNDLILQNNEGREGYSTNIIEKQVVYMHSLDKASLILSFLPLQLQMDKLPSRHAIIEVMSWISVMENIIQQDEDNIKNVVGQRTIKDYLQKYKVFKLGYLTNKLGIRILLVIKLLLVQSGIISYKVEYF